MSATMIYLTPGETFRHMVTLYTAGRDSPGVDLTECEVTVINLDPAPWDIGVQFVVREEGQFQLFIPDTDTQLAEQFQQYAFQIRLAWETGDKQFIGPVVISTGTEYLAESPPLPLAAE